MSGLWTALRYDETIGGILETLGSDEGRALLSGPPGVGKSYVARGIGAFWQQHGGAALFVEGDSMRGETGLYPFRFALSELSSGWSAYAPSATTLSRFVESFGPTQGMITKTIENLAGTRRERRLKQTEYLGDEQQSIFFDLERLGKKRPILLIADNLHWWDADSLLLLDDLMKDRIKDSFPFLSGLRVLGVQTLEEYQPASNPEVFNGVRNRRFASQYSLGRIQRSDFGSVLESLGAQPRPTDNLAGQIFDLTGGHLELADRVAKRIAAGDLQPIVEAARTGDFIHSLLTSRVTSLGDFGTQARDLLAVAAVLGLVFRREEILCAVDSGKSQTTRLLRRCRDECFLDLDDRNVWFVHDLYRQHFLDITANDRIAIHERLIDCLREIRPADYLLRSVNAVEAEQTTAAATLGALEALRQLREGATDYVLPSAVAAALDVSGLRDVIEQIRAALILLSDARYRESREILDRLPRRMPRLVAAEADFVRATCDMSTRTESDRARGRALLASWSDLLGEERELGSRMARLRVYGLTHLLDKTEARLLEQEVRRVLAESAGDDAWAEDAIYSMDRCAGRLLLPDFALVQYQEAAKHYSPDDDNSVVRRPVEYFKALANVLAGLVGNARFEDALTARARLDQFVNAHPGVQFPRPDSVEANTLIAEVRLGLVSPRDAADRQGEVIRIAGRAGDAFYLRNALAVYLAFNGQLDRARVELVELERLLLDRGADPETSSVYMIRSNLCGVRLCLGETDGLEDEWAELEDVVKQITYVVRPMYVRRHELLRPLFQNRSSPNPMQYDIYPIESSPSEFGPLWTSYGRGFILPEVEYWRED